jgi:hypothetical protein
MLYSGTRNYYVSTTGNDANDGLTALSPFRSLQAAFDVLNSIGFVGGTIKINIAAGTYSTSSYRSARLGPANASETDPTTENYASNGVVMKNWVIVQGADVGYVPASAPAPVPTTIFDGGSAASFGFQFEGPLKVLVRNIKFQNYDSGTSAVACSNDGGDMRTENVHGLNNNIDISSNKGTLQVRGGILDGASLYSIRCLFRGYHSIGNQSAGAAGQGPFIRNAAIGFLAQEGCTGHSDYVTYEDCADAIRVTVNSRVNYSGSDFKRCTRAVRADANSVLFGANTAVFNDGTADENDENRVTQLGGVDIDRDAYANNVRVTDYEGPVTLTGSTTSTAIMTKTLDQSCFAPNTNSIRKPQHIEFGCFGSISGSAGAKQFKLRLGSTLLATISNTAADTDFQATGYVVFTSPTDQKASMGYTAHNAASKINTDTGTEDMRAGDVDLKFEVQLINAADTVVVTQAWFKVCG